jgi:hypothetical protein
MKISVRYGIYIAIAVTILKLVLATSGLELKYAIPELVGSLILLVLGLYLSLRATQEVEYKGAALSMELLKAGLRTSAVFSLSFSIVLITQKIIQKDFPPSITQMIMGVIFLFIFVLIVGGLFSVFISYLVSKRK